MLSPLLPPFRKKGSPRLQRTVKFISWAALFYAVPYVISTPFIGWQWYSSHDTDSGYYGPFTKGRRSLHRHYRNPLDCEDCGEKRFSILDAPLRRNLARYCRDAFDQPDIVECVARHGRRWSGEPRSYNWTDPVTDAQLRESNAAWQREVKAYCERCQRNPICASRKDPICVNREYQQ